MAIEARTWVSHRVVDAIQDGTNEDGGENEIEAHDKASNSRVDERGFGEEPEPWVESTERVQHTWQQRSAHEHTQPFRMRSKTFKYGL